MTLTRHPSKRDLEKHIINNAPEFTLLNAESIKVIYTNGDHKSIINVDIKDPTMIADKFDGIRRDESRANEPATKRARESQTDSSESIEIDLTGEDTDEEDAMDTKPAAKRTFKEIHSEVCEAMGEMSLEDIIEQLDENLLDIGWEKHDISKEDEERPLDEIMNDLNKLRP